jgi:hypothetical protein
MKKLKLFIIGVILAAAVGTPLLFQIRAAGKLRAKGSTMREQTALVAWLSLENKRLSNDLVQVGASQSLTGTQLTELVRLRNEFGQLHEAVKEMDRLYGETEIIRTALPEIACKRNSGEHEATALLSDQVELRLMRVAQLRQWLQGRPEEKTPELALLAEESWIRSANWERVTDEEYGRWISAQRGNADSKFGSMTYKALKQYAQANGGQFPTDLSELKPFYASPIDDGMLQRWQIVPAKSLFPFLAERGGDWLITQKAPVNKKFDSRHAIGLTNYGATLEDGRWDNPR